MLVDTLGPLPRSFVSKNEDFRQVYTEMMAGRDDTPFKSLRESISNFSFGDPDAIDLLEQMLWIDPVRV